MADYLDLSRYDIKKVTGRVGINSNGNTNDHLSFGNFTFKSFPSQDDFDQYIGQADYGSDLNPAVCFGFDINEKRKHKYELTLMFQDE